MVEFDDETVFDPIHDEFAAHYNSNLTHCLFKYYDRSTTVATYHPQIRKEHGECDVPFEVVHVVKDDYEQIGQELKSLQHIYRSNNTMSVINTVVVYNMT